MSTFAQVLTEQLRRDPGRPLVTFYDDATGERVELSVTTYANWVAKTAGLCQEELDLGRGDTVRIDLPTHWLGPVWLGAAWTLGLHIVTTGPADLVVCGPDGMDRYTGAAGSHDSWGTVVALSLRPLGGRFTDPLPPGVIDYAAVVLGQPDMFHAYDPPTGDEPAWDGRTQDQLLRRAAGAGVVGDGGRLLTDRNPCTERGLDTLLGPVQAGGSTVWVAAADEASWDRRASTERATAVLRG